MKSVYHAGELEVQKRAGVSDMARRVGNGIHTKLPPVAQDFLGEQAFAVIGMADDAGQVWVSLLSGEPGFLSAEDEQTIRIGTLPNPNDPLYAVLTDDTGGQPKPLGMLAIDLATRRRMRVNGTAEPGAAGGFVLHVEQAYANCPKYIQAREIETGEPAATQNTIVLRGERLTEPQRHWIERADTFFIASEHPEGGADASHRGGSPGFVQVLNDTTLRFPDYSGNMMFNTLGNIAANPYAGLLFVDFETGDTLQLTGEAAILWDAETAAQFAGAERVVEFRITRTTEISGNAALHFRFLDFSRFNPQPIPAGQCRIL